MRRLPSVNLVANLPAGIVYQDFSLSTLNEHDKISYQHNQCADKQCHYLAHRP